MNISLNKELAKLSVVYCIGTLISFVTLHYLTFIDPLATARVVFIVAGVKLYSEVLSVGIFYTLIFSTRAELQIGSKGNISFRILGVFCSLLSLFIFGYPLLASLVLVLWLGELLNGFSFVVEKNFYGLISNPLSLSLVTILIFFMESSDKLILSLDWFLIVLSFVVFAFNFVFFCKNKSDLLVTLLSKNFRNCVAFCFGLGGGDNLIILLYRLWFQILSVNFVFVMLFGRLKHGVMVEKFKSGAQYFCFMDKEFVKFLIPSVVGILFILVSSVLLPFFGLNIDHLIFEFAFWGILALVLGVIIESVCLFLWSYLRFNEERDSLAIFSSTVIIGLSFWLPGFDFSEGLMFCVLFLLGVGLKPVMGCFAFIRRVREC